MGARDERCQAADFHNDLCQLEEVVDIRVGFPDMEVGFVADCGAG